MSATTLERIEEAKDAVAEVASRRHESWLDAICDFIKGRRDDAVKAILASKKFDADDARLRVIALDNIRAALEASVPRGPSGRSTPLPDRADILELERVLCPEGWRDRELKMLEKMSDAALADYLKPNELSEREAHLAHVQELNAILNRLVTAARQGEQLRQKTLAQIRGRAA